MSMASTEALSTMTVVGIVMLDPAHHNGDPCWDGDQTLWEATLEEGSHQHSILVVVARGDTFIPTDVVARRIEALAASCDQALPIIPQLEAFATRPDASRRPQVRLFIDPPGR
jgi:hypothetical protein